MKEFKDRKTVVERGCLDGTMVCVNLGEVLVGAKTRKRMFYCTRNFPEDCSKYGCPKMIPIDGEWLKDLRKTKTYE
jgi:hypothetical protein